MPKGLPRGGGGGSVMLFVGLWSLSAVRVGLIVRGWIALSLSFWPHQPRLS